MAGQHHQITMWVMVVQQCCAVSMNFYCMMMHEVNEALQHALLMKSTNWLSLSSTSPNTRQQTLLTLVAADVP
jgi:hypothetical protein